jgi:hypothetical protein
LFCGEENGEITGEMSVREAFIEEVHGSDLVAGVDVVGPEGVGVGDPDVEEARNPEVVVEEEVESNPDGGGGEGLGGGGIGRRRWWIRVFLVGGRIGSGFLVVGGGQSGSGSGASHLFIFFFLVIMGNRV